MNAAEKSQPAAPTAQDIGRACRGLKLEPVDGVLADALLTVAGAASRVSSSRRSSSSNSSISGIAAGAAVAAVRQLSSSRLGSFCGGDAVRSRAAMSSSSGGGGGPPSVSRPGSAAGAVALAAAAAAVRAGPVLRLRCKDLSTPASRSELAGHLAAFVQANENPACSPNFLSPDPDPVRTFVALLADQHVGEDEDLVLLLLKALKILSRKQDNRLAFGEEGVRGVLLVLAPPLSNAVAAEGANVLLNVCYEEENVQALLNTPAMTFLVAFLDHDDETLQANAAGAIQSVCFLPKGRAHVRNVGGVPPLLALLDSPCTKVVGRAVGAIHNMSADACSIRAIRTEEGIPRLVRLLSSEHLSISGSAAGALQNVSREVASRLIIRDLDAVLPLAALLSAPDMQAQVCAAGALLNILGPELEDAEDGGPSPRQAFGRIMSAIMAAAAVFDCVYEQRPPLE